MMIGTGLQNKLLEAMAMQIPCVTSTLANNALCAKEGSEVLIAATANQYAEHIVSLLEDRKMAETIGMGGFALVKRNFSWQGATAPLLGLL